MKKQKKNWGGGGTIVLVWKSKMWYINLEMPWWVFGCKISWTIVSFLLNIQEKYTELVNGILRRQPNPSNYQRLATAFRQLTPNDAIFCLDRAHRIKFQTQLESFLNNVRSLLIVKWWFLPWEKLKVPQCIKAHLY